MSIMYRKYQNQGEKSTNAGKWYAHALMINTISTDDIATEISGATTVTPTDVRAVLTSLGDFIKSHLQNSQKVTLDKLGSFSVSVRTKSAESSDKFTANNITGYRLNFRPEVRFVAKGVNEAGHRTGMFITKLLDGITCQEAPINLYGKEIKKKKATAGA